MLVLVFVIALSGITLLKWVKRPVQTGVDLGLRLTAWVIGDVSSTIFALFVTRDIFINPVLVESPIFSPIRLLVTLGITVFAVWHIVSDITSFIELTKPPSNKDINAS